MGELVTPDTELAFDNRRDTERLETFSDGVFAIAITLLVLEIAVPHLEPGGGESDLLRELRHLWPAYFGYLASFLTIGVMWANHHNIFHYLAHTDHRLVIFNTLPLFWIEFNPFPTALLAEYIAEPGERTATLVYGATFTITALF